MVKKDFIKVKIDYTVASSLVGVFFEPIANAFGGEVQCTYIRGKFSSYICNIEKYKNSTLCRMLVIEDDKAKHRYYEIVGRLMDLRLDNVNARLAILRIYMTRKINATPYTYIFHVPLYENVEESLKGVSIEDAKPWPWKLRAPRELNNWINLNEALKIVEAMDRMIQRRGLIGRIIIVASICKKDRKYKYPIVELCYKIGKRLIDCISFEVSTKENSKGDIRFIFGRKDTIECTKLGDFDKIVSAISSGVIEAISS